MMALAERIARLRERVRAAVSHVDLFPLVRGLERELSRDTPIGSDGPPRDECVAFSHPPDFRVPAGEVLSIEGGPASGGPSVVVRTALLGLLGTESPLPPGISEGVLFDDDEASLAFIDVFQHRALALLYRAWKRRAPSMALERSPDDAFPRALQSLAGTDAFSPYPGVDGLDPMFALGLSDVARCDPGFLDSSALEYLVRRTFPDLNARVTTPEPRIIEARPEDMTTLGTTRCTLGDDASYGVSAFDAAGFVQIEIGPVTRSTYEALLPGGEAFRRLQPLVSSWLASRCVAELVITMPVDEAPALSLGNEYGGKLGSSPGIARGGVSRPE
jgi:type VI secretion system protein ImpH